MEALNIKIYADKQCTKQLGKIAWKNQVELTDVLGKPIILENTAKGGEVAEAEIFVRNESHYDFIVTEITFPDPRVVIQVANGWLIPQTPVSIKLLFTVPKIPSPDDIVKEHKLIIQGYYIFK